MPSVPVVRLGGLKAGGAKQRFKPKQIKMLWPILSNGFRCDIVNLEKSPSTQLPDQ